MSAWGTKLCMIAVVLAMAFLQCKGLSHYPDLNPDVDVNSLEVGKAHFFKVPGGRCSDGSDFYAAMYISDAGNGKPQKSKLYVEFMGGGACFDRRTCKTGMFGSEMQEDTPGYISNLAYVSALTTMFNASCGVLPMGTGDLCDTRNPLREYSLVYIPYCTGDLHAGNNKYDYDGVTIYHYGGVNTDKVMQWVYKAFPDPETVVALGGSAGSFAAAIWGPVFATRYPNARVFAFADSMMHAPSGTVVVENWYAGAFGQKCWNINNEYTILPNSSKISANYAEFFSDGLRRFKGRLSLAMFTYDQDSEANVWWNFMNVQYNVTFQNDTKNRRVAAMWSMLKEINDTSPAGTFHSYVASGTGHHLTLSPDFYNGYVEPGKKDALSWFSDVLGSSSVNQHVWCDHEGTEPCSWKDYPKEEEREQEEECPAEDQSDMCKMRRSMTEADEKEMEDGFNVLLTGLGTCMSDCCWLTDNLGTVMGVMGGAVDADSWMLLVETCSNCNTYNGCPVAQCLAGADGCALYRHRGVRRILELICMAAGTNITDALATSVTVEGCCPTACGETAEVVAKQCKDKVDPSCGAAGLGAHGAMLSTTTTTSTVVASKAVILASGRILAGVFVFLVVRMMQPAF